MIEELIIIVYLFVGIAIDLLMYIQEARGDERIELLESIIACTAWPLVLAASPVGEETEGS
jgi:hypothetical protein